MKEEFLYRIRRNPVSAYLTVAIVCFFISLFTDKLFPRTRNISAVTASMQTAVRSAEKDFLSLSGEVVNNATDSSVIAQLAAVDRDKLQLYLYRSVPGYDDLHWWNNQHVLPDAAALKEKRNLFVAHLANGYYLTLKKRAGNIKVVALLQLQTAYNVTNEYLRNELITGVGQGSRFTVTDSLTEHKITDSEGNLLFCIRSVDTDVIESNGWLTIGLRLAAIFLFLFALYIFIERFYVKKGFPITAGLLFAVLLAFRLLTYISVFPLNFRQFELFDPSIYGSDRILRSLGDLMINALLFFWFINFVRRGITNVVFPAFTQRPLIKFLLTVAGVSVLLFATYTALGIIRSLIADSQISFDVLNFFSLDIYSVVGFFAICCVAGGYYYFCSVVFYLLARLYPRFITPLFISVAVAGLMLLSLRVGELSGALELWSLIWLLVFLLLIRRDLDGFFKRELIVSKLVFWLFFFSASVAAVIVTENAAKEKFLRLRYAEIVAAKTETGAAVLLSTQLNNLNEFILSSAFDQLSDGENDLAFRDSLINDNFQGFTDRYRTRLLLFDSTGTALNNTDPVSYNTLNTILTAQAKPTPVENLYYFDANLDRFSYITKRTLRNSEGGLKGYAFIIISPQQLDEGYPEPDLFNRGKINSLENSAQYAYAIYENGKLISFRNDYPFAGAITQSTGATTQYRLLKNGNYSELWYDAGGGKQVVLVKEERPLLESITLFSYMFCAFLLLTALSQMLLLIRRTGFRLSKLRNAINLSIRKQIHGTIIVFSALSFLVIGISTILFFIARFEKNNREISGRTIQTIASQIAVSVTPGDITAAEFSAEAAEGSGLSRVINPLAAAYGSEINLYSLSGDLKASSIPLPYLKGIVSTKMNPEAFEHLARRKEIVFFNEEQIGELEFASQYVPVINNNGKTSGYLNIPSFTSQTRLREEISDFLVTIINLNAFVLLIAGIVALIITNRITGSFLVIREQMRNINLGTHNEPLAWTRSDEIGGLVKEYNTMLAKLEKSAEALAKSERESAWSEMARQVAHEIKNPLTPMRLSMQFLQQAIETNSPDVKSLTERLSKTMIDQIDHLSNIAGDFSRFANIENARAERIDLTAALNSVRTLYDADAGSSLIWKVKDEPVFIHADKTHINRIFTNLILNAIQAVPAERKPEVSVEQEIKNGAVTTKITDNGSGIPDEVQKRIFTPNFTTKSSGTGLGLAMSKRMTEQAGGDVTYTTSKSGTTFCVKFPISK